MIKLKQYGLESLVSGVKYDLQFIAKLAHGAICAYKEMIGEGDLPCWGELDDEMKHSTLVGVAYVIKNPTATPQEVHQKWVDSKVCEGWSFGSEKNEETKEHPCLVDYANLPVEHRIKDHLFQNTILSVLNGLTESSKLQISAECGCESYATESNYVTNRY